MSSVTVGHVATQDAEVQSTPVITRSQPLSSPDAVDSNSVGESTQVVTESVQQNQIPKLGTSLNLSNITEVSNGSKTYENNSIQDDDNPKIPRAGLNQAFRRWKKLLFAKEAPTSRRLSISDSLEITPEK